MEIAIVGLDRMGGNMARRLRRTGVRVVGFDADAATRQALQRENVVEAADSVREMVARLSPPRVVWLMVPAGATTELMIEDVWPELARGDVIVDGGNAYYKDSQRRAAALASAGVYFVDCGVSGGVWGLENGYTLMYGANAARFVLPYMNAPVVADSGEGRWTILEAVEQGVPAPVLSLALMARFASQGRGEYAAKMLAMMRNSFGGHAVRNADGAKQ